MMGASACQSQTKRTMNQPNNPLLCNPDSGICELPNTANPGNNKVTLSAEKKAIRIIYYTDPICSSCWGIEPQLRKLKLEYGHSIEIDYRMGGLLPDWSYNSGGISKPSDVAGHWDKVSIYYDMPIDGNVWLEDPLHSSYPPSIAFKAAQGQDQHKAIDFLREIREMVFLQKKNICKWEHLETAAKKVGLDPQKLKTDYEGIAREDFDKDLKLGRELGVRGFPTMYFINTNGQKEMVYGSQAYTAFENAILKLDPKATKKPYDKNWSSLFAQYPSLTAKEFSELSGMDRSKVEAYLDELCLKGHLEKSVHCNGSIWRIKAK